jgi:arylsulfatase A-like enzyme
VGNQWFDRAMGRTVTAVFDPSVRGIGASGVIGASPWRLLVSTIGDELVLAGRKSRRIGISIKDRTAILTPGRSADWALWWHGKSGRFVSSSWYGDALPAWAEAFNARRPADQWAGKPWTPIDEPTRAPFLTLPGTPGPELYDRIDDCPYGNEMLVDLAEVVLDAESMGQDEDTDLLTVSFSANDSVGHTFGPNSPQVRDITRRTDIAIGRLLDAVERRVGLARTLVVLTSDHGVAPLPEQMERMKMPGGREKEWAIGALADQALDAAFGPADWIESDQGAILYLDQAVIRAKGLPATDVERVAADALAAAPHVWRVFRRRQLLDGQVPDDPWNRRIVRSFHAGRSGDILVYAEPYWQSSKVGTSHGTPFSYDTHVPLILSGWGIRPGRYDGDVSMHDVAPTIATVLRIETPSGSSGRVLVEAIAR